MTYLKGSRSRRQLPGWLVIAVFVCSALSVLSTAALVTEAAPMQGAILRTTLLKPPGKQGHLLAHLQPPTDAQCRVILGVACYSPQEIRRAYNMESVLSAGFTGKGQSIIIVDAFGSPTIEHDLHVFDAAFGLPDPPSFQQVAPLGTVPFDPNDAQMAGWADETTLDVEWAHAIAPDANIVLATSPVNETQGTQGLLQFLQVEEYALNHNLGNIISQSWGATENTLFTAQGQAILDQFNQFYRQAAQQHVTIFASSGDNGTANSTTQDNQVYHFPTVIFPASSPWVTAVGGTSLYASTNGNYQNEIVWNSGPNGGATGGGVSQYFAEPGYQKALPTSRQRLLNGYRGLPDIAYDADPHTGVLVYESFRGGSEAGYYIFGGTSNGSPQWAGIIADANQMAGHPLGFLNDTLYASGAGQSAAFHDIFQGNNSQDGVPGYDAMMGWDATTGWGTPRMRNLLSLLLKG